MADTTATGLRPATSTTATVVGQDSVAVSRRNSQDETLNSKRESTSEKEKVAGAQPEPEDVEAAAAPDPDADRYVTGVRLLLIFVGLLLSIFLVALDQTIIATALPVIASKFNALNELTWIVSVYFLTQAGLMLTFGQLLTITDTKILYLVAITIFEIGSLFCAVAWNMEFLIFGRAVAGVGASAIFISILTIIARVTRLEQRPILFGSFGAVFAISSVAGPLLGGALTDHLSWRWCFYINLPFGAVSIVAVVFLLKSQPTLGLPGFEDKTKLQQWLGIDWIGTILCLGMITPLLLALQWGGNTREWNDRVIIILFVVFAVLLIAFVSWQWKMGKRAIMPLWLYQRKTQIGTSVSAFFIMMNLIVGTYYIPFYYQAARGRSPTDSGIDILPYMLSIILAAAASGAVINFTGRYWYWTTFGPLVGAIGSGLLYTIDVDTSNAKLIGYQILTGVGVGTALQNGVIAIQTEWADHDELIPQATSIVTFYQLLGGILGIAIAGSVFANKLRENLLVFAPELPHEVAEAVRQSVSVISALPEPTKGGVIKAYVAALDYVFITGVPLSVVASLGSLFLIKNHNVKTRAAGITAVHMA